MMFVAAMVHAVMVTAAVVHAKTWNASMGLAVMCLTAVIHAVIWNAAVVHVAI